MKNVIIVGASRSGKSTVAKQLCKKHNMVYMPFDAIVSTIENLYPEIEIKHLDDNIDMSPKIAKFICEFIKHLDYEDINYVFDLYQLYPNDLLKYIDISNFVIVYMGYPKQSPKEKLEIIKKYARINDWTRRIDDDEMIEAITAFTEENKKMYNQCLKNNIPFFDTSANFKEMITKIVNYIEKNIN